MNKPAIATSPPMGDLVCIGYSDLEFYELLGQGAKGSVYRARWISADRIVAVKKLLDLDMSEARILSQVKHKNVISFIGAVSERPNYCIVSELAELGCLFDYLHDSNQRLDFTGIRAWAKQIASGMQYLHTEAPISIIHRDLKSKNIVISLPDRQCKICDFGSSKTVVVSGSHATVAGTPAWMAVELMLAERPATIHCDSWSYGVVLWELLTREVPFRGLEPMQIMYVVVQDGKRLHIPTSCPEELASLMRSCWATEPTDRPTCGQILKRLREFDGDNSLQSATAEFLQQRRAWQEEIQLALGRMQQLESQLIEARLRHYLANQRSQAVKNLRILRLEQFDVNAWREIDVANWLRHHSVSASPSLTACTLAGYSDLLMQHNITGERFLRLSDYDLTQIGVPKASHRASLLHLVHQLQRHNDNYRQYPPLSLTAATVAAASGSTGPSPAPSPVVARSNASAVAATSTSSGSGPQQTSSASISVSVVSAAAAAAFCPVRLTFIVNRLTLPDGCWKLCLEIEPATVTDEEDSNPAAVPSVAVEIDSVSVLVSRPRQANDFDSCYGAHGEGESMVDQPMVGVNYSYLMTDWMGSDSQDWPVTLRVCLQAYPPELEIHLTPWSVEDDASHRGGVCQLATRQVQLRQSSRSSGLASEDAGIGDFAADPKIAHHVQTVSTPSTPCSVGEHRPTFADMVKRQSGLDGSVTSATTVQTTTVGRPGTGSYRRCESSNYNYNTHSSSYYRNRRHHAPPGGSMGAPEARRLSDIVAERRGGGGGGGGPTSGSRMRRSATNGFG